MSVGRFAPGPTGRFAPSPTGALHLGNLRTALISWLQMRSGRGRWLVRMEDLDRVTSSAEVAAGQLAALASLGLHPDGDVVVQSQRFHLYRAAIADLAAAGRVYECFCTRRDIAEASRAAHAPDRGEGLPECAYPGTCRELDDVDRERLRRGGRRAALRLRTDHERITFVDAIAGECSGVVDDVVLQRNDGVPAYNLAVVVDDAAQGVTDVCRGDDLLASTPRQVMLQRLLDLPTPTYAHVPLVLAPDGSRLAKRHGAVTMDDLLRAGATPTTVLARLGASLALCGEADVVTPDELAARFSIADLPRQPWRLAAGEL